jgi:hypothetical protein
VFDLDQDAAKPIGAAASSIMLISRSDHAGRMIRIIRTVRSTANGARHDNTAELGRPELSAELGIVPDVQGDPPGCRFRCLRHQCLCCQA